MLGLLGCQGVLGAGTECRYSGDRRVIGAFGCSYGVLVPLGDIRGVFGAGSVVTQGQKYRWHKGAFGGSVVLGMFGAIRGLGVGGVLGLAGSVVTQRYRCIMGICGFLGMLGAIRGCIGAGVGYSARRGIGGIWVFLGVLGPLGGIRCVLGVWQGV